MMPVIYTTYGLAMGHRPETLAESRGLRPTGAERAHERPALVAISRAQWWLETMLVRVGLRHRDVTGCTDDMGETKRLSERLLRSPVAAAIAILTKPATTTTGGDQA